MTAIAQPAAASRRAGKGRHRRLGGTVRRVGSTLVTLAFAGMLAAVIVPALAGWKPYLVESGSMGEAVPVGSLTVMRPLAANSVKVGDVILLRRGNGTAVLHRVIERSAADGQVSVRTKGDANQAADPESYPVPTTTLRPAVILPKVGYAIPALRSAVGRCALVALAGLLLIVAALRRRPAPDTATPTPAGT